MEGDTEWYIVILVSGAKLIRVFSAPIDFGLGPTILTYSSFTLQQAYILTTP
jgi:hypothetical protein